MGEAGATSPQQSTERLLLLSSGLKERAPTARGEAGTRTSFQGNAPFFSSPPHDLAKHRQLCFSPRDDSGAATPSSQRLCRGSGSQLQQVRVLQLPTGHPALLPPPRAGGRAASWWASAKGGSAGLQSGPSTCEPLFVHRTPFCNTACALLRRLGSFNPEELRLPSTRHRAPTIPTQTWTRQHRSQWWHPPPNGMLSGMSCKGQGTSRTKANPQASSKGLRS